MKAKRPQRIVYLVTGVIVASMIGGFALATTSTFTITNNQGSGSGTAAPNGAPGGLTYTIGQVVILSESTDPTLGTGSGPFNQLSGTQTAVPSCGAPTCTDSFQPASSAGPAEVTGHYAQEFFVNVTQGCTGPTNGFDLQFEVNDGSAILAQAFSNTGTSTNCGSGSTVTIDFFVDLGVASMGNTAPLITNVEIVANSCPGTTSCP